MDTIVPLSLQPLCMPWNLCVHFWRAADLRIIIHYMLSSTAQDTAATSGPGRDDYRCSETDSHRHWTTYQHLYTVVKKLIKTERTGWDVLVHTLFTRFLIKVCASIQFIHTDARMHGLSFSIYDVEKTVQCLRALLDRRKQQCLNPQNVHCSLSTKMRKQPPRWTLLATASLRPRR